MRRVVQQFMLGGFRWRGIPVAGGLALGLLLFGTPGQLTAESELFGSRGVAPESVRQGKLGSCYFHAVVAAVAQSDPKMLEKMVHANGDGTYTVEFADGQKEVAYPEDIQYSRIVGYDLSDGLWVAVLFRAYAQKVLRRSLLDAIEKSDLFPVVKQYAENFVASSDLLVLAYDRAIRSQVDQEGNIDRTKLQARLKDQMAPVPIAEGVKESLVSLLDSGGFFDAMAGMIKQNGELFGAYRAVGQGGIAEQVMQTLAGKVRFRKNESEEKTAAALREGIAARLPLVACTGGSRFYEQVAAGQPLPAETNGWYVNSHCYTVLGFDSLEGTVKLRNPWAQHPDPDGVFSLPLSTFVPAFYGIVTSGPQA